MLEGKQKIKDTEEEQKVKRIRERLVLYQAKLSPW